jgi:hypothetical protein
MAVASKMRNNFRHRRVVIGLTLAHRSKTIPEPLGMTCPVGLCPIKPRHMDVYPSRNVDIREHRVPALQNKLIACGDRLRSAGAFLD